MRVLFLAVWTVLLIAPPSLTAGVEELIDVVVVTPGAEPPDAVEVEISHGQHSERRELALQSGRGELSFEAAEPGPWRLRARAAGFWSPEVEVEASLAEPVELDLWPAAPVVGEVRVPEGLDPPEALEIDLEPVPDRPSGGADQPKGATVVCALEEGELRGCVAPAGTWHLRLDAAGFAPARLWGVEVETGETADLGKVVLREGATVFGRVVTADGALCSPHARVELRPVLNRQLGGGSEALRAEIDSLTETAPVNGWGYFQLDGVPPGVFELRAEDEGYMPAILEHLEVRPGQEVDLAEPLVLQPALEMVVVVSPSEDLAGEPWTVRVLGAKATEDGGEVASGPAEAGQWQSPPLAEGRYLVEVLEKGGNRMALRQVDLGPGETQIWIELEYVPVEGEVVRGDEPLAAHLEFASEEGSAVATESDEEGLFDVVLPAPGTWLVDVRDEEANVDCRDIEVEIEADHADEVLIEVPDTSVRGRVVNSDGTPAADARAELIATSEGARTRIYDVRTGSDGAFALAGVQPGRYRAEARQGHRRSGIEVFEVAEEVPTPPITLVIRDSRVLRGRVMSGAGPVPAASLWPMPFTAQGTLAMASVTATRSNIDGSFAIQVPDSTRMVRIVTWAPGFALEASTMTLDEREEPEDLLVEVAPGGGTLRLAPPSQAGVVIVNGVPVDFYLLTGWAGLNGVVQDPDQDAVVPAMPAGSYGYCELSVAEAQAVSAGIAVPTSDACVTGFLSDGGTLDLAVPPR